VLEGLFDIIIMKYYYIFCHFNCLHFLGICNLRVYFPCVEI